jgi:tRNA G46 methylase TrmB
LHSHQFNRLFAADQLRAPRGFIKPILGASPILEIGAGKGHHALSLAQTTEQSIIAIERTRTKFESFSKLASATDYPNLQPVHADAIPWCVHALPPNTLAQVFLLYPNPERANPNQRWHRMPFMEFLLSRIRTGGRLTLATNVESYAHECEQWLCEIWQLPVTIAPVDRRSERTAFEVKYLARGERCWQIEATKPEGYVTRFDDWSTVR